MSKDRFVFGLAHNMVVIADPTWWMQNHIEIEDWLKQNLGFDADNNYARSGMVLRFNSEEEMLFFKMMWGN